MDEASSHTRIEQVIERTAADRGDRPAVSTSASTCDYRRLMNRSGELSDLLAAEAPGCGQPVGLLLPNGRAFVEAAVAIWRYGNVAVPISTDYSVPGILRIVETLGINVIVVARAERDRYAALAPRLVFADGEAWSTADGDGPVREPVATAPDHAVIFLTSGTTGSPKIVALTHRNILANLSGFQGAVGLGRGDRSFVCIPMCHSYGFTLQMLATLRTGGELYISPRRTTGPQLAAELAGSGCTSFFGVPATYRMLLDGVRRLTGAGAFERVRSLVNGASSMTPELLASIRRTFPDADVHLTYGLSEASPLVTALPPEWVDDKPCSIGRAVDGVDLTLRTEDGQMTTAAGATGEILIRGDSVIDGYLGNSAANERSFRGGYLLTGDVATIDAERCLYFKGRIKDLINRAGVKVYPEDIEAVLQAHALVLHSAVVPCPHPALGEAPFAFVVLREGARCTAAALRRWCARSLSAFQVPVGVELVDRLPRTTTNKIRKAVLAETLRTRQSQSVRAGGADRGKI